MSKPLRNAGLWIAMVVVVMACAGGLTAVGTSPEPAASSAAIFALTSPAFADGSEIPQQYGCAGADVSPPLDWTGAPPGTQELVLIVDDPDANGFLHWLLTDIPPDATGRLGDGAGNAERFPDGQGVNDFGRRGYGGPCPPRRHSYDFTLYALSRPLDGNTPLTKIAVQAAMADRLLAEAHLRGTYKQGA